MTSKRTSQRRIAGKILGATLAVPTLLFSLYLGAVVYAQQDQGVVAIKASSDPMQLKPGDSVWDKAPVHTVSLMAQPMILPRPKLTLTEKVQVQAVYNKKAIAFRLSWDDPEKSDDGRIGKFSDAVALQFPLDPNQTQLPSPFMGEKAKPVHIYHWRAQYQKDKELGRHPTMKDLYPNMSIDAYPLEFKDADAPQGSEAERRAFSPGAELGNPQSYKKRGIDEILAEGFGSSAVANSIEAEAQGVWANGKWQVVISRPLSSKQGSLVQPGPKNAFCVAVWQGGKNEVGSRKSLSMMWISLNLE
ncbi:MAG: hypothetical protein CVV27_12425 [Candidatus Melainabacteria bacterium HGW-Melainabacteria-1]|nr:MAG: hypothetical protein CVV27_12425 [Candidatus Melainabacteria bacterium HGW-Melainabacteria-1]